MKNLFISINFMDGDISSYKGVSASIGKEKRVFNSGDVTVDWINMYKWAGQIDYVFGLCSSSVDHFVTDSDGKFKRIYIDHNNNNEFVDNEENGLLYIVNRNINSFDDHLKYYKFKRGDI